MIVLAFIKSVSIILSRDTASETPQEGFFVYPPFLILFCLAKHFIIWPVEDLSLFSRTFLSQARKMSGNNSDQRQSPDLTTGPIISICFLK